MTRPEWNAVADAGPSRDTAPPQRRSDFNPSKLDARPTACRTSDGRVYQRTGKVWLLVSMPPSGLTQKDPVLSTEHREP
jgi:hypothetical protein